MQRELKPLWDAIESVVNEFIDTNEQILTNYNYDKEQVAVDFLIGQNDAYRTVLLLLNKTEEKLLNESEQKYSQCEKYIPPRKHLDLSKKGF